MYTVRLGHLTCLGQAQKCPNRAGRRCFTFPTFEGASSNRGQTGHICHPNIQTAVRGPGGNKLRTYRLFKTQWATEGYVKQIVNRAHRAALAKFRCGVAPLRLETGRFGRNRLPVNERICTLCNGNEVEDECHVIVRCPLYQDLREELFSKAVELNDNFNDLSDTDKMKTILSNLNIVKLTARSLFCILERRRLFNCEI